jgi:hypothetical protein
MGAFTTAILRQDDWEMVEHLAREASAICEQGREATPGTPEGPQGDPSAWPHRVAASAALGRRVRSCPWSVASPLCAAAIRHFLHLAFPDEMPCNGRHVTACLCLTAARFAVACFGAQSRTRTCGARRHLIYSQASLPLEYLCDWGG